LVSEDDETVLGFRGKRNGFGRENRPVGAFGQGLLVTHDEPESGPDVDDDRDPTNFSYVGWGEVAAALGLQVSTSAGNDPRFR
jgi:3-phytase